MVKGYPLLITKPDVIDKLLSKIRLGLSSGVSIRLVNAYSISLAEVNPEYQLVMKGEGINLIDGKPLAQLLSLKFLRKVQNIRGEDLFRGVMKNPNLDGIKIALIGGIADQVSILEKSVKESFPDANIVGIYSPPFQPIDNHLIERILHFLDDSKPDIIWVGLGTPKQDFLASSLANLYPGCFIGVGAVFNFISGSVRSAPNIYKYLGMEWFYRFLQEPKRLWKRYLWGNTKFLLFCLMVFFEPSVKINFKE